MADISELNAAFQAALADSTITALLAKPGNVAAVFNRYPSQAENFPCVVWYFADEPNNKLNADTDKNISGILTVTALSPDIPTGGTVQVPIAGETGWERCRRISGTIDGVLVDKPDKAAWVTANWRIVYCRRTSRWTEVTSDGITYERTADFTVRAVRNS